MDMDHSYCAVNNEQVLGDHDYFGRVNPRKSPLILKGNLVAQKMLKNAMDFFRTKFPDFNTSEITAECLGLSERTVARYQEGPTEESVQPQKRKRDLRLYMANERLGQSKKPYVLIDETWVFANGFIRKSWQDDDIRSVKKDKGEGARYIVVNAGTEKGFINGASFIFKAGTKCGDYHDQMNPENFEKWLTNWLPALEEPSILILDNASYP